MRLETPSFIANIEEEFDNLAAGSIGLNTKFREIEGWSSMMALITIAKIDSVYEVTISASELAESKSIADLFNLVEQKLIA